MQVDYARIMLRKWARYCYGGVYLGLPRQSLTEGMRGGGVRPAPLEALPDDVQAVEDAVRKLPDRHKSVIVEVYCHMGSMLDKARKLGMARRTLFRRLASAEQAVSDNIGS